VAVTGGYKRGRPTMHRGLVTVGICLALQTTGAGADRAGLAAWVHAPAGVGAVALRRSPVCHRGGRVRAGRGTALGLRAQIKFADAVEEVLVRKWDKKKVERVVKSWRRMDEDYIHKEFMDEHDTWQVGRGGVPPAAAAHPVAFCSCNWTHIDVHLSVPGWSSGDACMQMADALSAGNMQECNSYVEGLACKTFHQPYDYEWAQKLRDNARVIQEEFTRVAIQGSDDLDKKGNNVWATAANATSAQSYGERLHTH